MTTDLTPSAKFEALWNAIEKVKGEGKYPTNWEWGLADVLLALDTIATLPDDFLVNTKGRIIPDSSKKTRVWNLHNDSLDYQSEEVIAFLFDLLCPSPSPSLL